MPDSASVLDTLPPGLRTLRAFQEAHACAIAACAAVADFTGGERAILGDQIRRAAISLYANIAEGHTKRSRLDQARYYDIALGSLVEMQAHLAHAVARGFLAPADAAPVQRAARRTGQLLTALRDIARRAGAGQTAGGR